jgi:hypothetical protein
MWADVLATAIVARSSTELHWITVLGYEALTVTPDGGLTHTDGFVLQ